ncbi:MAG: protein-L-isoaspartate O-methyltransferase family protein [Alphaproteobacteria bacterium]
MVESQVRTNDVTDRRIIEAMETLPRERFVPRSLRPLAYMGAPLEAAEGRFLLDPRTLSKLIQAADIEPDELVLDVGCATGYSTAVLAHLAETVVGLEADQGLAEEATRLLTDLGIDNTAVITGDLAAGAPSQGPFDVIFINGGVEAVPESLTSQLKEGGRLAAVILGRRIGKAHIFLRTEDVVSSRIEFDATPPALPGFERAEAFTF